jgi:hypothetical protein
MEVMGRTFEVQSAQWSDDHDRIVIKFDGSPTRLKYKPEELIDIKE